MKDWKRAVVLGVTAYALASLTAVMTVLFVSKEFEWDTVGLGMFAALFLLPSIVLYVCAAKIWPAQPFRHYGYLIPSLGILAYLTVFLVMDLLGRLSEGSGLPLDMIIFFGVPCVITYVLLLWLHSKRACAVK